MFKISISFIKSCFSHSLLENISCNFTNIHGLPMAILQINLAKVSSH
ncbi:MAG: hypothetical protein WCG25_04580 [bacterium]